MSNDLRIGDEVRVTCASSQWRDCRGTVVEVLERNSCDHGDKLQECAVMLSNNERRWFMEEHLVKTVPVSSLRFFRSEVIERWKVNPDHAGTLDGSRDGLIAVLRDYYDYSTRHAEAEVDQFLVGFNQTIQN